MRKNEEYQLSKAIATYLRMQYPTVMFRFDMAGLNLSKTQAGMNKAIQYSTGYPDLQILEARNGKAGLFIELKKEGENLYKKGGLVLKSEHLLNQHKMLVLLESKNYQADFAIGFDQAKIIIDNYLK